MTNFHMISLGEDEMKNQICNIIRDFAILDTALLPTTCKQVFSKKPVSLIKTIGMKVKEEALTLYEKFLKVSNFIIQILLELAGCGFRAFRFQKLVTNFFGLTLVKTQFKNISPYNIVGIKYDKIDLKNKTTRQSQHAIYFTEYRENQIIAKDQQNGHYELKFDENLILNYDSNMFFKLIGM